MGSSFAIMFAVRVLLSQVFVAVCTVSLAGGLVGCKKHVVSRAELVEAVTAGNLATVKYAIEHGASVDTMQGQDSILLIAIFKERTNVARYLINAGADVNRSGSGEMTPLLFSLQDGQHEIAMELIPKVKDVNSKMSIGTTPLHMAARTKNFEAVVALLKRGAEVDPTNSNGDTPLTYACRQAENEAVIRALVKAGANESHRNKAGQTPKEIAASLGFGY